MTTTTTTPSRRPAFPGEVLDSQPCEVVRREAVKTEFVAEQLVQRLSSAMGGELDYAIAAAEYRVWLHAQPDSDSPPEIVIAARAVLAALLLVQEAQIARRAAV